MLGFVAALGWPFKGAAFSALLPGCYGAFAFGFVVVFLYGLKARRTFSECMSVALKAAGTLFAVAAAFLLLLLIITGTIGGSMAVLALAMAIPLLVGAEFAGCLLGYFVQRIIPRSAGLKNEIKR